MKTFSLLAALICVSLLSACGAAVPIAIAPVVAAGAAAVSSPAIAAVLTGPVLSDSAKVACAVQAVANDLDGQLPSAHPTASAISKYAGLACTWL